jgi:hypothetical protein
LYARRRLGTIICAPLFKSSSAVESAMFSLTVPVSSVQFLAAE